VPAAPFLIGFILGPMLENNFRQAMLMSRGDLSIFARGPITILFLCLTVISVVMIIRATMRAARTEAGNGQLCQDKPSHWPQD
jgi:putative tricarboxylic transport membrane protein